MNRAEVARGFGWNALFSFVNKALFPLIGILIARILGPSELGIYVTIAAILTVTEIFRDAGIGVTYIADKDSPRREGVYVSLSMVFGLAMGGALFVGRAPFAEFFSMPQLDWGLKMAAAAVAMNGLATVPANKLQKQARFREAGLADTLATLLSYGVAVPLVLVGYGFAGLVWQLVCRAVLYLAFNIALARPKRPAWNRADGAKILRLSFAAMLNNLAYTVYTLADKALIAKLFGEKAAGLYGVAYNVAVKPLDFVTFPLGRTLLVAFSQEAENRERLSNVFCRSMAAVLLISLPLFGLLAIFAEPVVVGLYSAKFEGAVAPFALLCLYMLWRSFGNLAGNAVFALGKPGYNVASWVPGYVVAGLGLWLGGGSRHLTAASAWIAAGAVAVYTINTAFALSLLRPKPSDVAKVARSALLGSVTLAIAAGASLFPWHPGWRLGAALFLGIAVHLVLVGATYSGSWRACFTRAGLREVWMRL